MTLTVKKLLEFIEEHQIPLDSEVRIQRIKDSDKIKTIKKFSENTEEYAAATACPWFHPDKNLYIDARY